MISLSDLLAKNRRFMVMIFIFCLTHIILPPHESVISECELNLAATLIITTLGMRWTAQTCSFWNLMFDGQVTASNMVASVFRVVDGPG